MRWSETSHSVADKNNAEAKMSVSATFQSESAAEYAKRLYRSEYGSWGDEVTALEKIGRWVGMSPRSVKRLIKGETKSVSEAIRDKFRRVYIAECERQLARLQQVLEIERARDNALDSDILAEVRRLAEKIAASKESLK